MNRIKRFLYLTGPANKALEDMHADQIELGHKISYSDLVSRAIETFETVGFKPTSCTDERCGYYYVYQCYCENVKQSDV